MTLRGRVALVTGGGVRIGRAVAIALAKRGADVVISYRSSRAEAETTATELRALGSRAEAIRADVSNDADVRRLMQRIQRRYRRVDVLVNNAARFERTPFSALTPRQWDAHISANLTGPFLCALHASRLMQRRGEGKIINIADWAGERPYRNYLPYCVSKAGVLGLTKALAAELAPAIQVIAISPGPMLPPPGMTAALQARVVRSLPLRRWGQPDDIANAVVFAIEGTDFITGATITVDGGRTIG
ncbi:MAG: SDR family oxidoreductase [Candidatus Omnitrophica bacterium]|nr:SDR family oxidoreductase [Candidatus Omnitrophota bacterium]